MHWRMGLLAGVSGWVRWLMMACLWAGPIAQAQTNTTPTFTLSDGIVTTHVGGGSEDVGRSLAIQQDGKILVAGYTNLTTRKPFLIRYNVDGSLDEGFASGGKLITETIYGGAVNQILLQSDGKILTVDGGWEGRLARYNNDGTPDTSFFGTGKVTTGFEPVSVAVQADGKIVVAGSVYNAVSSHDVVMARYNGDGSVDTGFGVSGKVTTDFGSYDSAKCVIIQPDSKILIGAYSSTANGFSFAVARYNPNGSLDTSFSGDGKATKVFGLSPLSSSSGCVTAMQPDGKILMAGSYYATSAYYFAIVRFNNDGTLDTDFAGSGTVTTDFGGFNIPESIAVQADGKIVVAGSGGNGKIAIARYNTDGSLDTTFNGNGKVLTNASPFGTSSASSIALQTDGKILVTGQTVQNFGGGSGKASDIVLVRYNPDGSPDATFSPAENTLTASPTYREQFTAVTVDANVQILDAELSAANSYSGASLTLSRNGGANTQDVFSSSGNTLTTLIAASYFSVDGTTIGRVTTNSAGILTLTFNSNATRSLVNKAMQQIAYANTSDAPPASVQIDWVFNDGNTGAQGAGGALSVTGSTVIRITAVNDYPVLAVPLPDITVQANAPLTFVIPLTTFSDPDGEVLTYSVLMADGTGLPPWLRFNTSTRTLSGTPELVDVGSFTIQVRATDAAGLSATDTVVVTVSSKVSQTIGAVTFSPNSLAVSGTTTASATASSGLAVTFSSTTPAICAVSSRTITGTAAGTCTIAANQAGNSAYSAAPQTTQNVTVSKINQTITVIGLSPNNLSVGAITTASATASSGLPVSFSSTTPTVCVVSGNTVTGAAAGSCTIAANQTGNATYAAAPQLTQTITVSEPPTTRLVNLSTRGQVLSGDDVMIGGFIIQGTSSKTVLIRAVGPTLANFGVSGVLRDPALQLFSGQTQIAANDDWQTASNAAAIQATTLAPSDKLESAILTTLAPGAYTAIVSGVGGATGVGIVEVYDIDHPEVPLINISTRGQVQTGDNVMIGGFIIQGTSPQTVLIRAVGPNLANFGVSGVLTDPKLELYSGQNIIASNDNWETATNAAAIQATTLAPVDPREAAILITLQPGAYTAVVSGANGGVGVGIIEVFAR